MTTPTVVPAHPSPEPGFPVAGPASPRLTAPARSRFPAADPAVGLVELPDPADMTSSEPSEVRAHLSHIQAARRRQLDALPATRLDAVGAAHRETVERILDEVRIALHRLDAGLYGTCTGCSGQIPAARLEVRPWTTSCATCAGGSR